MAVSIARDLDLLDKSIASLRLDYERFFSGDLKVPPLPARRSVEQVLRRVGNVSLDKAEERFRLQALQSRFTALSELWEKRLVAKEEGRGRVRPPIRVRSAERRGFNSFGRRAGGGLRKRLRAGRPEVSLRPVLRGARGCSARTPRASATIDSRSS